MTFAGRHWPRGGPCSTCWPNIRKSINTWTALHWLGCAIRRIIWGNRARWWIACWPCNADLPDTPRRCSNRSLRLDRARSAYALPGLAITRRIDISGTCISGGKSLLEQIALGTTAANAHDVAEVFLKRVDCLQRIASAVGAQCLAQIDYCWPRGQSPCAQRLADLTDQRVKGCLFARNSCRASRYEYREKRPLPGSCAP